MKKESGFTLVELMIVMVIFTIASAIYFNYLQKRNLQEMVYTAADQLIDDIVMIQQYEAESPDKPNSAIRFPETPLDIERLNYVDVCTEEAHERGECRTIRSTFWGEPISYERVQGNNEDPSASTHISTHLRLTYPLTSFPSDEAQKVAGLLMSRIPYATYDSNDQILTVRINRSSASRAMDDFLDRFGNTTLKDDWDVGGEHSILNAENITVANTDGTQTNLAAGVLASFSVESNTRVNKPSCPKGLEPNISTSLNSITGYYVKATGAFNTYYDTYSDYWIVRLRYHAVDKVTEQWRTYTTGGEVNVNISCVTSG